MRFVLNWWRGNPEIVDKAIRIRDAKHYQLTRRDLSNLIVDLLNCKTDEDIQRFVGRYGLLGLWECEPYRLWQSDKYGTEKSLYGKEFSKCYLVDEYKPGEKDYYTQWQEPLDVFHQAVIQLQGVVSELSGVKQSSQVNTWLGDWLKECTLTTTQVGERLQPSCKIPSLLHACYLGLWLDLLEDKKIRKCEHKHCGKFFYVTREDNRYCSSQCRDRAKRLRYYYKHEAKNSPTTEKDFCPERRI